MRALVAPALTCAALTTVPAGPAVAGSETEGRCPAPLPNVDYDADRMAVSFSVEASGCPAREESRFPLSIRIIRTDDFGVDEVARTRWCGAFRSADDADGVTFSCDIELAMAHEPEESAGYAVAIAWPGPDGQETSAFELGCVSQPEEAVCEPTHADFDH